MPNLAANLTMMFCEHEPLDRFDAARRAGFKGAEYLRPYSDKAEDVVAALRDSGLAMTLMNFPSGDDKASERGLTSLPGREADFDARLDTVLTYAQALECPRIHLTAGAPPEDADPAACRAVYIRNIQTAARHFAPYGITVLVEPINLRNSPGFYLNRQDRAIEILDAVGEANAALQMDIYNCQIVEGDVAMKIRQNIARIAYFQIAGVPERFEPDTGEVNYPYLFDLIDELGFDGWIGCEYCPKGDTVAGLGWAAPYGVVPA